MKGGSILKHDLKNGITQMYQVESIELGITGEVGLVKIRTLTEENPNGEQVAIPDNMVRDMLKSGILKCYDESD